MSAPGAPRPQTVGKSLFQFRNRAREKKTAAKPPAERSEANKICIYLYTAAEPPAERSEANRSIYLLIHGGEATVRVKRGYYLYTTAKPPAERSEANKLGGEAAGRAKRGLLALRARFVDPALDPEGIL